MTSRARAASSSRKATRWPSPSAFALLLIYLVLAAQFESFRDPFIILIGLPATVFGALFVLFVLGEVNGMMQNNPPINLGSGTINIYTQIGLVTLIGLIAKHGILMVEFANKLQETKGYDKHTGDQGSRRDRACGPS